MSGGTLVSPMLPMAPPNRPALRSSGNSEPRTAPIAPLSLNRSATSIGIVLPTKGSAASIPSRPLSAGMPTTTSSSGSPSVHTPIPDSDLASYHSSNATAADSSIATNIPLANAYRSACESATPEMRFVLSEYFKDDPKALATYLSAALGETGIIERHQDTYRNEFLAFMKAQKMQPQWVSRWTLARALRNDSTHESERINARHCVWFSRERENRHPSDGVDVLPASPLTPDTHYRFGVYPYSYIIRWLLHFLAKKRGQAQRYDSIVEIPRAYILPFLDRNLCKAVPVFVVAFARHVLRSRFPDTHQWWRGMRPTLQLRQALYPYQYVESISEDIDCLTSCSEGLLTTSTSIEKRSASNSILETALNEFRHNEHWEEHISRLVRMGLTAYLYLLYAFVQSDIGENNFESTDLVGQLLPILWAMVVSDDEALDPLKNPLLCRLYERKELSGPNDTSVLETMARMADEIRFVVLETHTEDERQLRVPEKLSREALVGSLFRRTHSLYGSTGTLRELCKMTLADESRMTLRRQIQVPVYRVGFTRFLHQLEGQLHLCRERQCFRDWLSCNLPWVRYDDLLWARCITADMPTLDSYSSSSITAPTTTSSSSSMLQQQQQIRLEQQRRAMELLKHIDECDRRIVVQRLSGSVTLDEVELSLAYYRAVFPACTRGLSDMFYVGVDKHGIYLVAERSHHAVLSQTMLLAACVSPGFRHNVPLFPALARLYYTTFDVSQTEEAYDAQLEERPVLHPDHHARHCVATILGHWLGLPTNSPNDRLVPIDGKTRIVTGSKSRAVTLSAASVSAAAAAAAAACPGVDRTVTVCECFIPDPIDELLGTDSDLGELHKFAARLEEALGVPFDRLDSLTDQLAEAIAGALELKRSRLLAKELVSKVRAVVPEVASSVAEVAAECCDDDGSTLVPDQNGHPSGKKRRVHFDMDRETGVLLPGGEVVAALYRAAANGKLSKELFQSVFLVPGGLTPVGRAPVTLASLRRSAPIIDESNVEKQYTRTVTGGYTRLFAVSCSTSLRGLKPSIRNNKEPIEPLGHLMRLLEARVAPTTLAEALGDRHREGGLGSAAPPPHVPYSAMHAQHPHSPGLMDNVTCASLARRFDFVGFLGARDSQYACEFPSSTNPHDIAADVAQLHPEITLEHILRLRAARAQVPPFDLDGAVPMSSATTYTPIQFWPSSEGQKPSPENSAPSIYTVYLENLFTVVAFPGGTYAHHLKELGASDRLIASEAYNADPREMPNWRPMLASRTNASVTPEMLMQQKPTVVSRPASVVLGPRQATSMQLENGNSESQSEDTVDEDDLAESAEKMRHRVTWTGGEMASISDPDQLWALMRAERNALIHVINTSRRLAETSPAPRLQDSAYVGERLLKRLRDLVDHSQQLARTTHPLPPDYPSLFHPVLFPFRFQDRAALAKYVGDVLSAPMPGESREKQEQRLWASVPDRSTYLLLNICKLYEACGSTFGDPPEQPSIEDAYTPQVDLAQESERFTNTYLAIAQEAIRRGLLHKAVRMQSQPKETEDNSVMSEPQEYFIR